MENLSKIVSPIRRLLVPIDYLRISHPEKRFYDFYIPIVLTLVATLLLYVMPSSVDIVGSNGLVSIFTNLLQILTGFYIASLTAVATFDRPSMDEVMLGNPPKLRTKYRGQATMELLTRRRFLSFLFGYLSLLSFILYFVGAFSTLLIPNIIILLPKSIFPYIKFFCVLIYLFLVSNLLTTTLLGFYYMTEKIHRKESREIKSG